MHSTDNASVYRIVIIGDTTVGKTSIVNQHAHQYFNSKEAATVGALFVFYKENVSGVDIEMQIWDTAGQERYQTLGPIYYRNAAAGIIVFDRTSRNTFENIPNWIKSFQDAAGSDAILVIAGNKSDLGDQIAVSNEEAEDFSKQFECAYFPTSAKENTGLNNIFQYIGKTILEKHPKAFDVIQSGPSLCEPQLKEESGFMNCC